MRWRSFVKDIGDAKGRALLVETTASGYGEGRANAPARDWDPRYLHPSPTDSMVKLADSAFGRVLAACGCSPALFDDSDGTSKREAQRQFHINTVQPLARILERELADKFGEPVRLRFDLAQCRSGGPGGRPSQKLVSGGMAIDQALSITAGLLRGRWVDSGIASRLAPNARARGQRRPADASGAAAFAAAVPAREAHTSTLGTGARRRGEAPLPGAVPRPCARCGKQFTPTMKRRLLCRPVLEARDRGRR